MLHIPSSNHLTLMQCHNRREQSNLQPWSCIRLVRYETGQHSSQRRRLSRTRTGEENDLKLRGGEDEEAVLSGDALGYYPTRVAFPTWISCKAML